MPSPFPGMDPYIEERSLWPDMHQRMITYMAEFLQPQVRPQYLTRIGERIELAALGKGYVLDVMMVASPSEAVSTQLSSIHVADEPQIIRFLEEERHVPYIEIIYRNGGEVVTLIELLSPANKTGDGREKYTKKQADLLDSQVNLVEIDLLSGPTATLARAATINAPHDWRYVVSISPPHRDNQLEVYAFSLNERLPRCRIPLREEDPDVVLDLPAVFTRSYDIGGYDLLIDYGQMPPVSLSKAEQEWLTNLLNESGIRQT